MTKKTGHTDKTKGTGGGRPASIIADVILPALIGGAGMVFILGFFFPDPHVLEARRSDLLWVARLGGLSLTLCALALYWGVRRKRMSLTGLGIILASVFLASLLAYPVLSHVYYSRVLGQHARYHPYLQLDPPLYEPRGQEGDALVIFCLGGSTTEFKDSEGIGWPARVGKLLGERTSSGRVEVHNLGRQWYTSLHSLMNFRMNLRQYKPDMVIMMHGINDLLQNADFSSFSMGAFRQDYGHFVGPTSGMVFRKPLLTRAMDVFRATWFAGKHREIVDTEEFPGLHPFVTNLTDLVEMVKAYGGHPVLMTQPSLFKSEMSEEEQEACYMINIEAVGPDKLWSVKTGLAGMTAYAEAVRRTATDTGTPLIDLEKRIPKTLEYFSDDVHYTDKAFDLVGSTVAEELQRMDF